MYVTNVKKLTTGTNCKSSTDRREAGKVLTSERVSENGARNVFLNEPEP